MSAAIETLDQAALDRLLDQRAWARDMDAALARYARESGALRARLPHEADIAYGPLPTQRLDWYAPPGAHDAAPGAPIVVFVHGGAWRSGSKESNSFAAGTVLAAGAHFVPVEFSQCPDVSLATMAEQVCAAIAWVHRAAEGFGADGQRIVLAGHSSGCHLLALALAADWQAGHGLRRGFLRGAICSSGFYDLAPVARSARNAYLKLADDQVTALSPLHQVERISCPVFVSTGELDNPLMQAQADAFAARLDQRGLLVRRAVAPGLDHFEVAETYQSHDGLLGGAVSTLLRLARSAAC